MLFLKSVALTPEPGAACRAKPSTLSTLLNVVTLLKSTKSSSPLRPVIATNESFSFALA